jgi:YidC/Oxa1 family membrane protein insertase
MDNRKFIFAIALSLIILVGWQYFIEAPRLAKRQEALQEQQAQPLAAQPSQTTAAQPQQLAPVEGARRILAREEAIKESPRVAIDNPQLKGSISLKGARIDDLVLKNYRATVDPGSPSITLLSPLASERAYYADFGWAGDEGVAAPSAESLWRADGDKLTPQSPVTLTWDNGQGLTFTRRIALDIFHVHHH